MPRSAGKILVEVKVTMRDNVQPRALLIVYHHRQPVLKLFAKTHIEHARVQRPAPHAHVAPTRPRKRPRNRARKNQIGGGGEHSLLQPRLYFRPANPTGEEVLPVEATAESQLTTQEVRLIAVFPCRPNQQNAHILSDPMGLAYLRHVLFQISA